MLDADEFLAILAARACRSRARTRAPSDGIDRDGNGQIDLRELLRDAQGDAFAAPCAPGPPRAPRRARRSAERAAAAAARCAPEPAPLPPPRDADAKLAKLRARLATEEARRRARRTRAAHLDRVARGGGVGVGMGMSRRPTEFGPAPPRRAPPRRAARPAREDGAFRARPIGRRSRAGRARARAHPADAPFVMTNLGHWPEQSRALLSRNRRAPRARAYYALTTPERYHLSVTTYLRAMDKNGDGVVSRTEQSAKKNDSPT